MLVRRAISKLQPTGFPLPADHQVPEVLLMMPRVSQLLESIAAPAAVERVFRESLAEVIESTFIGGAFQDLIPVLCEFIRCWFGLAPETTGRSANDRADLGVAYVRSQGLSFGSPSRTSDWDAWILCYDAAIERFRHGAPEIRLPLPGIKALEDALARIIRYGLPLRGEYATSDLLAFLPPINRPEGRDEQIARMDQMLREHLERFEVDALAEAARILFAVEPGYGGAKAGRRDEGVMRALDLTSIAHARDRTERSGGRRRILEAFASQIYRTRTRQSSY